MPLPMKTLREAAAELGMPDSEVKAMIDMGKIRAVWRAGKLNLAPDEIAKLRRLRKTLPESEQRSSPPAKPAPVNPAAAKGPAAKPAAAKPATTRPAVPRQGVKLPPPPPQ